MTDAAPKPFKDIGKSPRPDNKFDTWFKGGKMDKFFKVTERLERDHRDPCGLHYLPYRGLHHGCQPEHPFCNRPQL